MSFVARAAGQRFRLGPRFTVLFLVMALLVTATGTFGIRKIGEVGRHVQVMMKTRAAQEKMAVLMKMTLQEARTRLLEVAMTSSATGEFDAASYEYEATVGRFRGYMNLLLEGNARVGLAPVPPGSKLEDRVNAVARAWSGFETVAGNMIARKAALVGKAGPAAGSGAKELPKDAASSTLFRDIAPASDEVSAAIDELLVSVGTLMNETQQDVLTIQRGARIALQSVIVSAIVLALALGLVATNRMVIQPIMALKTTAERIASGDFAGTLPSRRRDEIAELGRAINGMAANLQEMFLKLRTANDVLETVDEAFVIVDANYRILDANRAYCEQTGMTRTEAIGQHCHTLSHNRNRPCFESGEECVVHRVFETGEPHTVFHTHRARDGSVLQVETKAFPMRDSGGAIISVIEIVHDITEKKKLEDQLRSSQKMEAVGLLAGGVAHDFNNLLQAIVGYGSLLQMKLKADDPLAQHVEQILQASSRAAELTSGLLAFSRKQVVNPAPVDLNEIVRGLAKILLRVIGEDVDLKIICADQVLTVLVDQGQISQVLMNLTTNARDALPKGGTLTIGTGIFFAAAHDVAAKIVEQAGPHAVLSVADSGIGMDPATIERIFEPFFTTKELGRGTGLGLSMVYGIIKRHHGHINVASEPGGGATFKIFLPLVAAAPQRSSEEPARPVGGTETVLLAEDELAVRSLMKTVLGEAGYTVIEAPDGEAAIAAFHEHLDEIRLAVLDVIMPRKNGREVADEIRRSAPEVKILFMSGYTDDVIARQGLLEQGIELIVKPVDPTTFLRRVRATLDRP